jgi:trehalose synthase
MKEVDLVKKDISIYKSFINRQEKSLLLELSQSLKGKKIAFVNSTSFGGGVAELFHSIIPLSRSMGVDIHWFVLEGDTEFFSVTKKMHNMLQGKGGVISDGEFNHYLNVNRRNAEQFSDNFDIIVVHDPQPMALPMFLRRKNGHFVWRCHIDTTAPNLQATNIIHKFLPFYEDTIFSMNDFARGLKIQRNEIIYPSIDPLSEKNMSVSFNEAVKIVEKFGVDIRKPILVQISRFDPWKDPIGVIDVYRKLKVVYKDLQLVLIGSMATDDPEGWQFYQKTLRHAGEDNDIFILSNLDLVGNKEVNAFQRVATIVLQKSIREGFGLTVSEALWKKRAVIGGNVGGITVQIRHGENGYLVSSNEECIRNAEELILDEKKRVAFGEKGFQTVHGQFLITRHIKDYLVLFNKILSKETIA